MLDHDDPATVKRMLVYLYTSNYNDEKGGPASTHSYMADDTTTDDEITLLAKQFPEVVTKEHIKLTNNVLV